MIKPLWKSVCISPAANGAVVPFLIVQLRTSLGPAVKNVSNPKRLNADLISLFNPGSDNPYSLRNKPFSSSDKTAISCSSLLHNLIEILFSSFAYSDSLLLKSLISLFIILDSLTLAIYSIGLFVSKLRFDWSYEYKENFMLNVLMYIWLSIILLIAVNVQNLIVN